MATYANSTHERHRMTALHPTKSAVCGLLGACLGRDRQDDHRDLYALHVHVREDQPGTVTEDFQTVEGATRASGEVNPDRVIVRREYLQDSAFLVVVEGDPTLLTQIEAALRDPYRMPYLGTRACPPSRPVYVSPVSTDPPLHLLEHTPLLAGPAGPRRAFMEDPDGPLMADDQPLPDRRFGRRYITPTTVTASTDR